MSSKLDDDLRDSSSVYVIKPDNLVFKNPIEIFYQENMIMINNLLTFFSFKKPSNRLRTRLEFTISRIVKRLIKKKGHGCAEPRIKLSLSEKTSNLHIRLPEEGLIEKNEAIYITKRVFSKTCQNMPEYSVREYHLLPMTEDYYTFFILLTPYGPEIKNTLNTLRKVLEYPFITLPDARGEYYSSEWEEDSIFGTPRIIQRKLLGTIRTMCQFTLNREVATYKSADRLDNSFFASPEFIASIFKELAQAIMSVEDTKRIQDLLEIINKFMRNEIWDPRDIERAFNCLSKLVKGESSTALSKLFDYFHTLINEIKIFETLEKICIARSVIKRITRAISQNPNGKMTTRNIVNMLFKNYLLTGSIISKKRKRLINLGGGKAIYISPKEWKLILSEMNNISEEAKIELKIVRRSDGKKSIVIEIIEE